MAKRTKQCPRCKLRDRTVFVGAVSYCGRCGVYWRGSGKDGVWGPGAHGQTEQEVASATR